MSAYSALMRFIGVGSDTIAWRVFKANSKVSTAGYATDCGIASGKTGTERSELMSSFKNKQWANKKPERKRKNLIRLGVDHDHAYQWSRTRPERSESMNTIKN